MSLAEQIRATANYYAAYFANRQVSNADVRAFQREIGAALDALETEHADKVWLARDEARGHRCYSVPSTTSDEGTAYCPICAALGERLGGAR